MGQVDCIVPQRAFARPGLSVRLRVAHGSPTELSGPLLAVCRAGVGELAATCARQLPATLWSTHKPGPISCVASELGRPAAIP